MRQAEAGFLASFSDYLVLTRGALATHIAAARRSPNQVTVPALEAFARDAASDNGRLAVLAEEISAAHPQLTAKVRNARDSLSASVNEARHVYDGSLGLKSTGPMRNVERLEALFAKGYETNEKIEGLASTMLNDTSLSGEARARTEAVFVAAFDKHVSEAQHRIDDAQQKLTGELSTDNQAAALAVLQRKKQWAPPASGNNAALEKLMRDGDAAQAKVEAMYLRAAEAMVQAYTKIQRLPGPERDVAFARLANERGWLLEGLRFYMPRSVTQNSTVLLKDLLRRAS